MLKLSSQNCSVQSVEGKRVDSGNLSCLQVDDPPSIQKDSSNRQFGTFQSHQIFEKDAKLQTICLFLCVSLCTVFLLFCRCASCNVSDVVVVVHVFGVEFGWGWELGAS